MRLDRKISTDFWSDNKIEKLDLYGKYIFLYLLTNDKTTFSGCYEFSITKLSFDTQLSISDTNEALKKLVENKLIDIDESTNEILILNWSKHNWGKHNPNVKFSVDQSILKSIENVKSEYFKIILIDKYNSRSSVSNKLDISFFSSTNTSTRSNTNTNTNTNSITITNTSSVPTPNTIDTSDSDSKTFEVSEVSSHTTNIVNHYDFDLEEQSKKILEYFNFKTNKNYSLNDKESIKYISIILMNYTYNDCIHVIDTRVKLWLNDHKMSQYLRPKTLFDKDKFVDYLNTKIKSSLFDAARDFGNKVYE